MNARLIADAGATKIEWALIGSEESSPRKYISDGINAAVADDSHNRRVLADVVKHFGTVDEIYFYGAGCATDEICRRMRESLSEIFKTADIFVESDLLGAARALCRHEKGIACILGTGSNSCLYDGEKIADNRPSLGFILGDEGSGSALGKHFLADVFRGILPKEIGDEFRKRYGVELPELIEKVYRSAAPNKFIASSVPFICEHIDNPEIRELVLSEFRKFFERNVCLYPEAKHLPICFTGSVATVFEKELREVASEFNLTIGRMMKSPMEGLLAYHSPDAIQSTSLR